MQNIAHRMYFVKMFLEEESMVPGFQLESSCVLTEMIFEYMQKILLL